MHGKNKKHCSHEVYWVVEEMLNVNFVLAGSVQVRCKDTSAARLSGTMCYGRYLWSPYGIGQTIIFLLLYIFIRHKAASKQTNNHTNRQTDRRQKKQENNAILSLAFLDPRVGHNAILRLCPSLLRKDMPNPRTSHPTPAAPPQRIHTTQYAMLSN